GAQINGTGNDLANLIVGSTSANRIDGGVGNDTLQGGAGNDTLIGGVGIDSLVGGTGDDVYVVDGSDFVVEATGSGLDTVQSVVTHTLALNVENLTLTGLAAINGTGNTLANVLTGNAANNNLDGGEGNDTFSAGDGNDTILGGGGNDFMIGGTGADSQIGGAGDDTYTIDSVGDSVNELLNEGTDTVITSLSYTLGANVENLTLYAGAQINGIGNDLANLIVGSTASNQIDGGLGNDTLLGGAGNDTINGGDGNDSIIGGDGNDFMIGGTGADSQIGGTGDDTYTIDNVGDSVNELLNEGSDTVITSLSYTLGANVENLTLYAGAQINGTGNDLANLIVGSTAANAINGGLGNDTLQGGAGNDTLQGGLGRDLLVGGTGADVFLFDTTPNATTNLDVVSGLEAADQFALSTGVFTGIGGAGALAAANFYSGAGLTGSTSAAQGAGIYFDTTSGGIYYDADGQGGAASVQVATVTGGAAVTSSQFLLV
ncbi:calcium-binding protein, partial [Leptothrix discophora]